MRYELRDVPDDLPVGKHPTRVLSAYRRNDGKWVIPVEYAPDKRVVDSALPLIRHADDCTTPGECRCGWVHHDGPEFTS